MRLLLATMMALAMVFTLTAILVDKHAEAQFILTIPPSSSDIPTWSPDGKRIAYVLSRGQARNIHTMNTDGASKHGSPQREVSDLRGHRMDGVSRLYPRGTAGEKST